MNLFDWLGKCDGFISLEFADKLIDIESRDSLGNGFDKKSVAVGIESVERRIGNINSAAEVDISSLAANWDCCAVVGSNQIFHFVLIVFSIVANESKAILND